MANDTTAPEVLTDAAIEVEGELANVAAALAGDAVDAPMSGKDLPGESALLETEVAEAGEDA
ncbi:MAG TPA: hypothetical protein VMT47_12170, partial [Polyangia bacterium]|nr:hypothetical protein [Polyangia bacterium]